MTRNERRLLAVFSAVCLLGVISVGLGLAGKRHAVLMSDRTRLLAEWTAIEALLEDRDMWSTRALWLDANQPAVRSREEIDRAIYEEAMAENVTGVSTSDHVLMEGRGESHYVQAGVEFTVKGAPPDVFGWLHSLDRPEDFRVLRNLRIRPDSDAPGQVVCQLELLRWYAPLSSP